MYLNVIEGFLTRGRAVSPHLMVVRKTPGGTGYVINPGFAQQALEAAKDPKHDSWFDIMVEVRLSVRLGQNFDALTMHCIQHCIQLCCQVVMRYADGHLGPPLAQQTMPLVLSTKACTAFIPSTTQY
jgi:hypothetical protein